MFVLWYLCFKDVAVCVLSSERVPPLWKLHDKSTENEETWQRLSKYLTKPQFFERKSYWSQPNDAREGKKEQPWQIMMVVFEILCIRFQWPQRNVVGCLNCHDPLWRKSVCHRPNKFCFCPKQQQQQQQQQHDWTNITWVELGQPTLPPSPLPSPRGRKTICLTRHKNRQQISDKNRVFPCEDISLKTTLVEFYLRAKIGKDVKDNRALANEGFFFF